LFSVVWFWFFFAARFCWTSM